MEKAKPIRIPLLNPNEPEAMLVSLAVKEGQLVQIGDVICTLETTKSAEDVRAESEGYIIGLQFLQGESVTAGDILGYISPTPFLAASDKQLIPDMSSTEGRSSFVIPPGLRITKPALALAQQSGLDLGLLPTSKFVTVEVVRKILQEMKTAPGQKIEAREQPILFSSRSHSDIAIVVYGGGGHGKTVIDLLRAIHMYHIIGVIDDGLPAGKAIAGLSVLGGAEILPEIFADGVRLAANAVGGIGNINIRMKVFETLVEAGFRFPTIIHPKAYLEPSSQLEAGIQVFAHAYIGSEATIGFGCIVNTGAIISHECILNSFANISPGAILAGNVQIGERVLIGMGATINLGVRIGNDARIGNGATVKADVPEKGIVQAGTIWPK